MYVTIPEGQYQIRKAKEQNRAYIWNEKEKGDCVKLSPFISLKEMVQIDCNSNNEEKITKMIDR